MSISIPAIVSRLRSIYRTSMKRNGYRMFINEGIVCLSLPPDAITFQDCDIFMGVSTIKHYSHR